MASPEIRLKFAKSHACRFPAETMVFGCCAEVANHAPNGVIALRIRKHSAGQLAISVELAVKLGRGGISQVA